jgi:hypothetical protein
VHSLRPTRQLGFQACPLADVLHLCGSAVKISATLSLHSNYHPSTQLHRGNKELTDEIRQYSTRRASETTVWLMKCSILQGQSVTLASAAVRSCSCRHSSESSHHGASSWNSCARNAAENCVGATLTASAATADVTKQIAYLHDERAAETRRRCQLETQNDVDMPMRLLMRR